MANGTPPVVLVDDNDDILQVTRKGLELHGFEVHAFNDPVEALKHVEGCKDCQVLVSDIRMPKKPKRAGSLSQLLKKARQAVKRAEHLTREREAELARMDAYIQAQRESTKRQSPLF